MKANMPITYETTHAEHTDYVSLNFSYQSLKNKRTTQSDRGPIIIEGATLLSKC